MFPEPRCREEQVSCRKSKPRLRSDSPEREDGIKPFKVGPFQAVQVCRGEAAVYFQGGQKCAPCRWQRNNNNLLQRCCCVHSAAANQRPGVGAQRLPADVSLSLRLK